MLPAMSLQLGVVGGVITTAQQLCIRVDIADEGVHEDLLLAVSFDGKPAYRQSGQCTNFVQVMFD